MKSMFLILLILTTLTSCGQKGETGKASFKLVLGNIVSSPASFSGGLIILGRRVDGSQKFTLGLTAELELNLKKGAWEFATIGWTAAVGGKKMTGPHICSYQQVELRDDNQAITFNMNDNNCINAVGLLGNEFSDSQYLSLTSGSGTAKGFKRLHIIDCSSISIGDAPTCTPTSGSSTIANFHSYKLEIPSILVGIEVQGAQGLSECLDTSSGAPYSDFQIPAGGANGFIGVTLKLFTTSNSDCSGTPFNTNYYPNGFGVSRIGNSMLSPKLDPVFSGAKFNNLGAWSVGGVVPVAGRVKGDLYELTSTNSSSPSAVVGDYIYYDGSSWQVFYAGQVTFQNGKLYINDGYTYLYLKPL